MEIVLATRNKGKIKELKSLLSDLDLKIYTLDDFINLPKIKETGKTCEENAAKKAIFIARAVKKIALADDSVLEIDALNKKPGIKTARFTPKGDEKSNNAKILKLMKKVPKEKRTAKFKCAIAISDGKTLFETAYGECEGLISEEEKGNYGFGYDPIFIPKGYKKTFAEMTPPQKNKISHRAKAVRKIKKILLKIMKNKEGG
jgi:XTP/dITP diphosphohydrolase